MKKGFVFVLLMLSMALLAGSPPASAQVTNTDRLQQFRADLRANGQALVAANLGLTDAEGQAFWPVYRAYREEMAKTGDRLQKLIQQFARVYETATDAQAREMVDEMMAIQRDQLKVRKSYLSKFRKAITEVKVARLLQIENKIDAAIMVAMSDTIPLIGPAR